MTRSQSVQIAGRLSYREQLEAYFRDNPTASDRDAVAATGAPTTVARFVRQRLAAAGVVRISKGRARSAGFWASL